ncbi:hypothetical protein M1506_01595 [Patescibacteria group bacterium]|nr:hypothetical protein [Patescibacteria group bacterium]
MEQKLNKISQFDFKEGHYVAEDGVVMWCFDKRLRKNGLDFLENYLKLGFDFVSIASGGLSRLTSGDEGSIKFVLEEVGKSVKLHKSPTIILTAHNNCGDFGGVIDANFYIEKLDEGERKLKELAPGIKIRKFFIDFDAIYEVN